MPGGAPDSPTTQFKSLDCYMGGFCQLDGKSVGRLWGLHGAILVQPECPVTKPRDAINKPRPLRRAQHSADSNRPRREGPSNPMCILQKDFLSVDGLFASLAISKGPFTTKHLENRQEINTNDSALAPHLPRVARSWVTKWLL